MQANMYGMASLACWLNSEVSLRVRASAASVFGQCAYLDCQWLKECFRAVL